jgi:hypothetical protein
VLISAIAPANSRYAGPGQLHPALPLPIDPARTRWLITVPVGQLREALDAVRAAGATFEHIYDF